MYRATIHIKAQCPKHPKYNPEKGGQAAIRGACATCEDIFDTFQQVMRMRLSSFGVSIQARIKQELSPEERKRRQEHARNLHKKEQA